MTPDDAPVRSDQLEQLLNDLVEEVKAWLLERVDDWRNHPIDDFDDSTRSDLVYEAYDELLPADRIHALFWEHRQLWDIDEPDAEGTLVDIARALLRHQTADAVYAWMKAVLPDPVEVEPDDDRLIVARTLDEVIEGVANAVMAWLRARVERWRQQPIGTAIGDDARDGIRFQAYTEVLSDDRIEQIFKNCPEVRMLATAEASETLGGTAFLGLMRATDDRVKAWMNSIRPEAASEEA